MHLIRRHNWTLTVTMAVCVFAAWAVLAVLGWATPADAHHVNEPTTPIEHVELRLQHYATRTPIDCDTPTPQVFPFDKVRIEASVGSPTAPSEHWTTKLTVNRTDPGERLHQEWNGTWHHANVPPHGPKVDSGQWEHLSFNQYRLDEVPGATWHVDVVVTGDETGTVLTDSCAFTAPG